MSETQPDPTMALLFFVLEYQSAESELQLSASGLTYLLPEFYLMMSSSAGPLRSLHLSPPSFSPSSPPSHPACLPNFLTLNMYCTRGEISTPQPLTIEPFFHRIRRIIKAIIIIISQAHFICQALWETQGRQRK